MTDFSAGTDKVDLTAFDIEGIEDLDMTTGDDGVTVDLGDIDGGTILLADLTTLRRREILWYNNFNDATAAAAAKAPNE